MQSWAITLVIVVCGAGFLILVAVVCAFTPRHPPRTVLQLGGHAHRSAPTHQGAHGHHQSAPAHQAASQDSTSVDSELVDEIQEALSSVRQGADDDIELSILTQTQEVISSAHQSASEDIELSTQTQNEGDVHPFYKA